ncbi:MAG TPA: DUF1801 domain-containing protein [Gemmatimonadales bacterium]|jgi:hypothetical protein|nr:DUF1801 domain-containing protein [Gemmatimonadales bacterium]
MKAYASFDDYLRAQSPGNQMIIRALRRFVKAAAPRLRESVKWGNGCWLAGTEPVAYVHAGDTAVQFGFFMGASLRDPRGLLQGSGRYVRHLTLRKAGDFDRPALRALLRQAVSHRRPTPRTPARRS